jgi:hypothetical protein
MGQVVSKDKVLVMSGQVQRNC